MDIPENPTDALIYGTVSHDKAAFASSPVPTIPLTHRRSEITMEIFMQNIAFSVTDIQLKKTIAQAIHEPEYLPYSVLPLNLDVSILPQRKYNARGRVGKLTLPSEDVGEHFLRQYGALTPSKSIVIGTRIKFSRSNKSARSHILEQIRRLPYVDPVAEEERQARVEELRLHTVAISSLQFGWECRDNTFSIEWEMHCGDKGGTVIFDNDRREFRIEVPDASTTRLVAIRAAQITGASASIDDNRQPTIYITLAHPPSFESLNQTETTFSDLFRALGLNRATQNPASTPSRQRQIAFESSHESLAPYTSNAIRLVCPHPADLNNFRSLCHTVHIRVDDFVYPAVRRNLFSEDIRARYATWIAQIPSWPVAFQIEALARNTLFDLRELLGLRDKIYRMSLEKGNVFTTLFLRHFATQARSWYWYNDGTEENQSPLQSAEDFFSRCAHDYAPPAPRLGSANISDTFECLHVIVTPTTIHLEGPYPERSNRVVRLFPRDQDSFLRVSFGDETNLQYRFDREVDARSFIRRRVGQTLSDGLDIAGRHFEFLAYSQSALKEHAVWFVKPFIHGGRTVNAAYIIRSLGSFDTLESDPQLIYCPARYGARISQAFTATDSSISVDPEQILTIDDIEDPTGQWCFTDGVGTISPEMAREIWKELSAKRRRGRRRHNAYPRAYQVRFMGSKGMVSVDYELSGRVICIRRSMIKFEAPNSRDIEIARAFDKPSPFNLNRPLIMILEGLGVPFETFQTLQENAVSNAQRSVESLSQAAQLLETYGLGSSFQLTSVMLSLDKLGVGPLFWDHFWRQMMAFAIHHVLRELKHHARIPVPKAWNLVGVADIHGYLEEGEIFVHIVPNNGEGSIYLEGDTMVTRSPTIHPGDVQIARAVGKPPPDSPFARETLRNCVVFSIKGRRPLASCLGGGDLDGDLFCCTTLPSLLPRRTYAPAPYTAAVRVLLDRPSTMKDVADFVTEYIYSDNLGVIAKTWLTIADQSEEGIFDPACLTLSQLHSDAVDYPKSGRPVPLDKLPRTKFRAKPDWDAPEMVTSDRRSEFYESQRAIGKLFRAINLPALPEAERAQREQRRKLKGEYDHMFTLDEVLGEFYEEADEDDIVRGAVESRVLGFISLGQHEEHLIAEIWDLFSNYRSQLQTICADNTLSRNRSAMLTEEEAVVGTIVAKCTQPRMRRDLISKLREQTGSLVQSVEHQLAGEVGTLPEKSLERGWVAYRISLLMDDRFGAKSFGWIALRQIFDSIREIENENDGFFSF